MALAYLWMGATLLVDDRSPIQLGVVAVLPEPPQSRTAVAPTLKYIILPAELSLGCCYFSPLSMILIDNQKFACSACINGHRSSSCHHTERPLFEIKKKGRPISQCERCRELRKTRSYHSKCLCDKPADAGEPALGADKTPGNKRKKGSRTAPKTPALPNGVKDLLDANKSPDSEQREEPRKKAKTTSSCTCGCDSTKRCRCGGGEFLAPIQAQTGGDACCIGTSYPAVAGKRATPSRRVLPEPKKYVSTPSHALSKDLPTQVSSTGGCCAPKTSQEERFPVQYRDAPIVIKPLSLPPDSASPGLLPSIATWTTTLPSLHTHSTTTMDSFAAAAAVAAGHHSCPDRCGTCQDRALTDMHITTLGGAGSDDSSVESLLARAIAKLPPPPPGKLSVFQSAMGEDRVALVVLPRLDPASGTGNKGSCCGGPSVSALGRSSGDDPLQLPSLFPQPPQFNASKSTARFRRRIRSPSPSDDELTDADAEGEIDPENEPSIDPATAAANNDWALAQFDIDVDLELELAVDAIDRTS
ncbi:metal-binding regulatory protein cuf1 [Ceratobasidium sp. AG-Ba]|nr:metal-binding regulatory protein cuf1 [Ceratobasidium sp. AG-Ba]